MQPLLRFIRLAALSLALTIFLSGCDLLTGTIRTAKINRSPSCGVIGDALRATPGVTRLQPLSGSTDKYCHYYFWKDQSPINLSVEPARGGSSTLRLANIWMNCIVPKSELDRGRSAMNAVYASLRRADPSLPPPAALKETRFRYPSR